jgi:hypothetical protein
MHQDDPPTASSQGRQDPRQVKRPSPCQPPVPDLTWDEYEDLSKVASDTGIRYPVVSDPRIRLLLEKLIDPVKFERMNRREPMAVYALIGLRFLLDRFPAQTRFRYSVGPAINGEASKVPVVATFHRGAEGEYFVALSLDIFGLELNA